MQLIGVGRLGPTEQEVVLSLTYTGSIIDTGNSWFLDIGASKIARFF